MEIKRRPSRETLNSSICERQGTQVEINVATVIVRYGIVYGQSAFGIDRDVVTSTIVVERVFNGHPNHAVYRTDRQIANIIEYDIAGVGGRCEATGQHGVQFSDPAFRSHGKVGSRQVNVRVRFGIGNLPRRFERDLGSATRSGQRHR